MQVLYTLIYPFPRSSLRKGYFKTNIRARLSQLLLDGLLCLANNRLANVRIIVFRSAVEGVDFGALESVSAIVRFFPGTWLIVNWNLIIRILNVYTCRGSSSKFLELNNGTRGLWSVCMWNCVSSKYGARRSQAHVKASASFSIWAYHLSVGDMDLDM